MFQGFTKRVRQVGSIGVSFFVCVNLLLQPSLALAANLTAASDSLSRQQVSVAANHDIRFTTPSGVDSPTDTIVLTFPSAATVSTITPSDVSLSHGAGTGFETGETLAGAAALGVWGVNVSGSVLTLTPPTNAGPGEIAAGSKVVIRIGTHAGGTHQIMNPAVPANYTLLLNGGFGDALSVSFDIISNDTISLTATVPEPGGGGNPGGGGDPGGGPGGNPGGIDGTPPVISNIRISNVTQTGAQVLWDTDESADSRVDYGTTIGYGALASDGSRVTSHTLPLIGLTPDTTYHLRVTSKDATGNVASSNDVTFRTAPPAHAPVISQVQALNITDVSALISWATDIDATSLVEYGVTNGYGQSASAPGFISQHGVTLAGLSSGQTYHFRVSSQEQGGLSTTSPDFTFSTPADVTPPANPLDFRAQPGNRSIQLTWSNPLDLDFAKVILVSRTDRSPLSPGDGRRVYEGKATSMFDSGLTNGTHYFYTLFAVDAHDNISSGSLADAIPTGPIVPPKPEPEPKPPVPEPNPKPTPEPQPGPQPGASSSSTTSTTPVPTPGGTVIQIQPELYVLHGSFLLTPDGAGRIGGVSGQELFIKVPLTGLGVLAESGKVSVGQSSYLLSKLPNEDALGASVMLPQNTGNLPLVISVMFSNGALAVAKKSVEIQGIGRVTEAALIQKGSMIVAGARVELFVLQGSTWVSWNSADFSQSNPQVSAADGSYFWYAPNGSYQLRVSKEGYQDNQVEIFVTRNIATANIVLQKKSKDILQAIDQQPSVGQKTATAINEIGRSVQEALKTIQTPEAKTFSERVLTPTLIAVGAANVATAATVFNILNYLRFFFTQPLLLFNRRKRKKWGVVYDALTKVPVELAIVRLVLADRNLIVQTRITNRQGQFSFWVRPGKYRLIVVKPGYVYPSVYLKEETVDVDYVDLYHGETIAVNQAAALTVNIPLDPVIKEETPKEVLRKKFLRQAQNAVAMFGIFAMFLVLVIAPSWWSLGFFIFQVLVYILFRRLAVPPRPKEWGMIYDQTTGQKLGRTVVRIFSKRFNKLLETQVTDENGKYGFFAAKDVYYVTAEKPGYSNFVSSEVDLSKTQDTLIDQSIPLQRMGQPSVPASVETIKDQHTEKPVI